MRRDLASAVATAQEVASTVVAAEEEAIDKGANWPAESFAAFKEAGLMGLNVPAEHGGWGLGLEALAKVTEAIGYESGSAGICFGMHCVGTAVIASKATPDHVERYLQPIARGEHITTLALSEPGTGVHLYLPETRIERDGGSYVVHGTKTFVTNGGYADSYVLSAQSPRADELEAGTFTCVLVPNEGEGLSWNGPWTGWGMRGNSSIRLDLDGVQVPVQDRLGSEDDQIWYVFHVVVPHFLMAMSGTYLGLAQRALDAAIDHVKQRQHSHTGRALSESDVLQHRVAKLWNRVERTRRLIYWAAQEADRDGPHALSGLMAAKAEVADCAVDTINDCMTLTGGIHYREGALLQRLLRDARAAHVMAPTTDMLLTWQGRRLLDQPMLGP